MASSDPMSQRLLKQLVLFVRDEEGASAMEYALIAGCIAVIIVAALVAFGVGLNGVFVRVQDMVQCAVSLSCR